VIVISPYPLSGGYRRRLEEALEGAPAYVTLPELRRLPFGRLVRSLRRGRGDRCVLAIEDSSSYGILPVLETVSVLVGASRLEVAHPDLRLEPLSRARAATALTPLVAASVGGQRAVRRAKRELRELLRSPAAELPVPAAPADLLYLNPTPWFGLTAGGSVTHVAGVVNALTRRGVAVTLASAPDPVLVDERATYVRLPPPAAFGLPFETNRIRFQQRIVDDLVPVAPQAEVVYQRHAVTSYAGAQLSRRRSLPLVLEYNGSEVWAARHWGRGLRYADLALAAEEASLRHAHLVVTISKVLAHELRDRGVPEDRIVCYPNCVDASVFEPTRLATAAVAARGRYGIPNDAIVVAFVGTFGHWHGAERFAEAIARMRRETPDWTASHGVRFLFVGDGLKMDDVRRVLDGAENDVTFTGLVPQSESPALLAASDVLVSPHVPNPDGSRFFGSPTKLFEYMAAGKGIVASDLDQIGEILSGSLRADSLPGGRPPADATSPAVLTKPGSVDDLVASIRFLVGHPEWCQVLGANARTRVLAHYTWDHHVDAIYDGLARAAAG
jgi:glycosyltransferase involved in cell wall biosynthesis